MESKVRSLAQVCDLALAGFSSTLYGYKGHVQYATFQPPPDILRQIPEVRFDDASERWTPVAATATLDRTALRKRHHVVPDPGYIPPVKKAKFYPPPSRGVKLRDVNELMRESRETKGMSPKEYDEYRRKKETTPSGAPATTATASGAPPKQQHQQQQQQPQQRSSAPASGSAGANPVQDILNEIAAASKPRNTSGSHNDGRKERSSGLGVRKSNKDEHLFKRPTATAIQRKGSNSSSSSGSTPAAAPRATSSAKSSVGKRPTPGAPAPTQKRPCVDLLMIRSHLLGDKTDEVETRKIASLLKRNLSGGGHMSILVKKKPKLVLHIPKSDKENDQVPVVAKHKKLKSTTTPSAASTPEPKPAAKKERKQDTKAQKTVEPKERKAGATTSKDKEAKRDPTTGSNDKFTLPTGTVTAEFLKTLRIPKRKSAEAASTSSAPAATTTTTTTTPASSSTTTMDRELEEGETISPSPSPVHRSRQPSPPPPPPPPPPGPQQQQPSSSSSSSSSTAVAAAAVVVAAATATTRERSRERSRSASRTRRDRSARRDDENSSSSSSRRARQREDSERRRGTGSEPRRGDEDEHRRGRSRDHSVDDRRRHRRDSRQSSSDDRHRRHRSRSPPSARSVRRARGSRSRSDSRRRSRSPRRRSSNLSSTNSSSRSKSPPQQRLPPPPPPPAPLSADTPVAPPLPPPPPPPPSEPSPPKPNYKNATSADAESEEQCKLYAVMFRKLATAYKHRGDPHLAEIAGLLDHMQAVLNYVLSFYYQDLKSGEYHGLRHWESLHPFSSLLLRHLQTRKETDLYAMCSRMMGMVRYYTFVRREAVASKKLDGVVSKDVDVAAAHEATKASKQAFADFEEAYKGFKEADRHLSYEQFRARYPRTFADACVKGEYGPGIVIGGEAGTAIEPRYPFIPFAKLHHAAIVCKCMLDEYVDKNAIKYTPIQDTDEYM